MPKPTVLVNTIRAFDDPRNRRLGLIWDALAEYHQDKFRLMVHSNLGCRLSHDKMLNRIWEFVMHRTERFVCITEQDFLPSLDFLPITQLSKGYPIIAATYCTRDPDTKKLIEHKALVGAWYILVDREYVDLLDFTAGGPFNDPANNLLTYVHDNYGKGIKMLEARDCLPTHYGVEHMTGEHLFFSRHLADPPDMRVAGMPLGDIQRGHDRAVASWIDRQPHAYRRILCSTAGGLAASKAAGLAFAEDR